MQSYAVDEWEERGLLLEATFTPLAFGGQWLPGTGVEHQRRLLEFGNLASTGRPPLRQVRGAGGLGLRRLAADRLPAHPRRRRPAAVRDRARGGALLRRRRPRGLPQISGLPTLPRGSIAELEASPPRRRAMRLEAFHPMGTARMDADPRRGVTGTDGAVHGAEALYVADGSLLPSSIGVNPMMTIIAMASRVARQAAERLA